MTNKEYSKIIAEIETLPTGGITYKKINEKSMHITNGARMESNVPEGQKMKS